jgi:hypothetical protein
MWVLLDVPVQCVKEGDFVFLNTLTGVVPEDNYYKIGRITIAEDQQGIKHYMLHYSALHITLGYGNSSIVSIKRFSLKRLLSLL